MTTNTDTIRFIDLIAQQKRIRTAIDRRIAGILDSGLFIMGPEVFELEERLSAFCGACHAIACASGTDALIIALLARGVGPGDAIFTTPFTFIATAEVISLLGATPVFVDVDPDTYNISPDALRQAIEVLKDSDRPYATVPDMAGRLLKPKGVIGVDLYGLCADYNAINKIADDNGLFVIEDAAQSFGSTCRGKKAGTLASIATTSFYPAKPLGGYGEGGAIFTDDAGLAETMRSILNHGASGHAYENVRIGINGRMDSIQAAVLLEKLTIFEDEIRVRQQVATTYDEALAGYVKTPVIPTGFTSVFAQYSVQSDRRDGLLNALKQEGIPTAVHYPKPLHLQKAFAGLGYGTGDFPNAESVSQRIFSLPMHPYLKPHDLEKICSTIKATLKA